MPDPAIRIENLGKKYIIDCQQQQQYSTLRDTIASGIGNLFKPVVDPQRKSDRHPHQEEFCGDTRMTGFETIAIADGSISMCCT